MCGCLAVADDVHSMLSTRQKHVDAVGGAQEAARMLLIRAYERNNDDFGLFTLEVVNRGKTKSL
jgi:hypothetical protein